MLDKFLDDYIDILYQRQNNVLDVTQKGLYSKQRYYKLLKPVIKLVSENKDKSLSELTNILYEDSNIEGMIKNFVYDKQLTPGLVLAFKTKYHKHTIYTGYKKEVDYFNNKYTTNKIPLKEDAIFDLASVTKLFTVLSIFKLVEKKMINLDDDVVKYVPYFKNIKSLKIIELLSFQIPLETSKRIDEVNSKDEALDLLFNIKIGKKRINPYTDMGAMILKYVIEEVTKMSYFDFLKQEILNPLGLKDTNVRVKNLDRCVNTNYDIKYYKDDFVLETRYEEGIAHDYKAYIMGQKDGNLSGHAGLFSTANDMITLADSLMKGKIISKDSFDLIARNYTGRSYFLNNEKKYIQYFGLLCYTKNPDYKSTVVPHPLSGKAIASAGYTGMKLIVDPLNEITFFMGSNRTHNRMSYIDEVHKDEIKTDKFGKQTIDLPNGLNIVDSSRFAWVRQELVDAVINLTIKYRMLEDLYEVIKTDVKVKHLQM